MPSAPPSSRVVSFTAEPTPAFESGTVLMISPVAGAAVMPMPAPRTAKADREHDVRRGRSEQAQDEEAAGDDHESGRHHTSGAEARGEHRAVGATRATNTIGSGSSARPASSGEYAAAELQVLRGRGRRSRTSRRMRRSRRAADAEPPIAEERERQHRMFVSGAPSGGTR